MGPFGKDDTVIDLRAPRAPAIRSGGSERSVLLTLLSFSAVVGLALLVLGILSLIQPRQVPFDLAEVGPFEELHEKQGNLYRVRESYWVIDRLSPPTQGLEVGDTLISIDAADVTSPHRRFGGGHTNRRALFDWLKGKETVELVVSRAGSELAVEVSTMRPRWYQYLGLWYIAPPLVVILLGFLALRARSGEQAVSRFVIACVAISLSLGLPMLVFAWLAWINPFFTHTPIAFPYIYSEPFIREVILAAGPALLVASLLAFIRLLHVFPTHDAELARRAPASPWIVVVTLVAFVLFVGTGIYSDLPHPHTITSEFRDRLLGWLWLLAFAWPTIVPIFLAVRIVRLARARLKRLTGIEERQQARLALGGVGLGFGLLILALLVGNVLGAMSPPRTFGRDLRQWLAGMLLMLALILPFVGFFVAILRRGLWDVDVILRRASVYSVFTGLFVVMWPILDVTVEGLLPKGLFGANWIGTASAGLLAAALVAGSRGWITRLVGRRFFPEAEAFGDDIERLSQELSAARTGVPVGRVLGERLCGILGARPCSVLLRRGENFFERVWCSDLETRTAPMAVAAVGALERNPSAILMLDRGPVLAARIGTGPDYPGLLLLGPNRRGRFYSSEDRRLLTLLLNQVALLLPRDGRTATPARGGA